MTKTNFKYPIAPDADGKEKWKTQGGWLSRKKPDAVTDDALAHYTDTKKHLKSTVTVGNRHAELQVDKWTDKVFIGDNVNTTAHLSQSAAKRSDALMKSKANLIESAQTDAETPSPQTKTQSLASCVDLIAVNDIRKALRRKYASRSNIDRIFAQWDKSS